MARRFYMLVDIEADIEPFPIHYLNVISKAKSFQNFDKKSILGVYLTNEIEKKYWKKILKKVSRVRKSIHMLM